MSLRRCVDGLARATRYNISRSRSEEHTSELQSQSNLVCRLLLEKKNNNVFRLHPHPGDGASEAARFENHLSAVREPVAVRPAPCLALSVMPDWPAWLRRTADSVA